MTGNLMASPKEEIGSKEHFRMKDSKEARHSMCVTERTSLPKRRVVVLCSGNLEVQLALTVAVLLPPT